LFLPLYLIKYVVLLPETGGAGKAVSLWFSEIWVYQIMLSVVYGAVVGWIAKELLHFAEERKYVDRESFLVFAVALAVSAVSSLSMI
jgi:NhaP-type Na+/H+ or K+/H+ antiporter